MTGATTWHGRRGAVLLGPTEHRVARWLADLCRAGRVTVRTVDLATACRLERSEAYRITRRLRILGLFGIENDQGGTRGGRRYWRTAVEHDAAELDPARHREAWARVHAWARARLRRLAARLTRQPGPNHMRGSFPTVRASSERGAPGLGPITPAAGDSPPGSPAATFSEQMRRAGLGPLMDGWGVR